MCPGNLVWHEPHRQNFRYGVVNVWDAFCLRRASVGSEGERDWIVGLGSVDDGLECLGWAVWGGWEARWDGMGWGWGIDFARWWEGKERAVERGGRGEGAEREVEGGAEWNVLMGTVSWDEGGCRG